SLPKDGRLLAHTKADNAAIIGNLEPLVGREWRSNHYVGQYVAFNGIYFTPGSQVREKCTFAMKDFSIWHLQK
ncbi:MAG: hypothetical protein D6691_01985, partial [Candidatus Hydrogenedentota bacterium]